jgi:hypothetical protein
VVARGYHGGTDSGSVWLWPDNPGPHARQFRRAMWVPAAVMVLICAALAGVVVLRGVDMARTVEGLLFISGSVVVGLGLLRGRVTGWSLVWWAIGTVALASWPTGVEHGTGQVAALYAPTFFCLVCLVQLRWKVALGSGLTVLVATVVVQAAAAVEWRWIVANAALVTGFAIAGLSLLRVGVATADRNDRLLIAARSANVARLSQALEVEATDSVRRVLHDEVIGALIAVADLPDSAHEHSLNSCRDAVAALKRDGSASA